MCVALNCWSTWVFSFEPQVPRHLQSPCCRIKRKKKIQIREKGDIQITTEILYGLKYHTQKKESWEEQNLSFEWVWCRENVELLIGRSLPSDAWSPVWYHPRAHLDPCSTRPRPHRALRFSHCPPSCCFLSKRCWKDLLSSGGNLTWPSGALCVRGTVQSVFQTWWQPPEAGIIYRWGNRPGGKRVLFRGHTVLEWKAGIWTASKLYHPIDHFCSFFFESFISSRCRIQALISSLVRAFPALVNK